jgi:hypothetical protein
VNRESSYSDYEHYSLRSTEWNEYSQDLEDEEKKMEGSGYFKQDDFSDHGRNVDISPFYTDNEDSDRGEWWEKSEEDEPSNPFNPADVKQETEVDD